MNRMKSCLTVRRALAVLCLASAGLFACRLEVPIREMTQARHGIMRATEVKAEKYAPEELGNARNLLLKSHQDVGEEKVDQARESAVKSKEESDKAIAKSLPLLSRDTYNDSKKTYDEAELLFAERYASAPFAAAGSGLKEADKLHNDKSFWESYQKSAAAGRQAAEAKSIAEAKIPEVRAEIARVEGEAQKLGTQRGQQFASSEIGAARQKLQTAGAKVQERNLKAAVPLIDEAKASLAGAEKKTLKGIAEEKLAAARTSLQTASSSPMKSLNETEINRASSLVKESGDLAARTSYRESIEKSDQALGLLSGIKSSMDRQESDYREKARVKLEQAQSGLTALQSSPDRQSFQQQVDMANTLVNRGKTSYDGKSYQESMLASDEALALISSVNASIEKKARESAQVTSQAEQEKVEVDTPADERQRLAERIRETYVVKYNPRDRDCLWKIAGRAYSNPRMWPLIYVANKDIIRDPDLIFPGQKLKIPEIPEPRKTAPAPAKAADKGEGAATDRKTEAPTTAPAK